MAGQANRALATLKSASARGCAWERGVIANDPYLEPIRGPELEHVLRTSEPILEREQARLRPVAPAIVPAPERKGTRGALVCLHGRADRAAPGTVRSWRAAVSMGFALVIPQSSRLTVWPDKLFGWTDRDQSQREIGAAWTTAVEQTPRLGEVPLVIGGLSIGADYAINISLSGAPLKPNGFIGVAPPGREIEIRELPSDLKPIYGTLIVGVWDYRREAAIRLWTELTGAGAATQLIGVARVGHAMPPQSIFAPRLRLALAEILSRRC